MNRRDQLAERIGTLKDIFEQKGRSDVCLVIVTKYSDIDDIEELYFLGERDFGENRVDELIRKANYFVARNIMDIRWHFIGNLQTNKINRLLKVPCLNAIHSVDSIRLLDGLYKREKNIAGNRVDFFLQLNTSEEKEKGGFCQEDEISKAANLCLKNPTSKLRLVGLMTMAKIRTEQRVEDARECFKKTASQRDRLTRDFDLHNLKLSMGMGGDFEIALEEKSNIVRIGRFILQK